jgi:hypothetical protein
MSSTTVSKPRVSRPRSVVRIPGVTRPKFFPGKTAAERDAARRAGDWGKVLACHYVENMAHAFAWYAPEMDDASYWTLLGHAYVDEKHLRRVRWLFDQLLRSERPGRHNMMSPEDYTVLQQLPDSIEIYRGYSGKGAAGTSWTLDRRIAVWFAHRDSRWNGEPIVIRGTVRREDVYAYCSAMGEAEIIVPSELVQDQVPEVDHSPRDTVSMPLQQYMQEPFDVTPLLRVAS